MSKWVDVGDVAYVILRCTRHARGLLGLDRLPTAPSVTRSLPSTSSCPTRSAASSATHSPLADSFQVPVTAIGDTVVRNVAAFPLPINKPLRTAVTGSGRYTYVVPIIGMPGIAPLVKYDGTVPGKWLRVRYTPLRRMTVTGGQSTAGKRVNGLKGFRLWADVYRSQPQ